MGACPTKIGQVPYPGHPQPSLKWHEEAAPPLLGDPDQRNGDGSGPKALSPVVHVTEHCRPVEGTETPACQLLGKLYRMRRRRRISPKPARAVPKIAREAGSGTGAA